MGTFNVTSSTLNDNYEFTNDVVVVNGSYTKNAQTDTLQNVSGSVYLPAVGGQGEYLGNFNGYMRDGEVKYSISEMSRKDANKVWDAIDEIELNIIGTNGEEAQA
jgi:hypothetical protein